jgi:hypothetical protein
LHVNVQSQSQLYVQGHAVFTDRLGEQQSLLVVSEKRNIIRTLPPVVQLKMTDKRIVARPGETLECRLQLERTPNFSGPMRIELKQPNAGFVAEPLTIDAGVTAAVVRVHLATDVATSNLAELTFVAQGHLRPDTPLVSEASVKVIWP